MTEDQLEQLCLQWFHETGWETLHGPDIAHDGETPMRSSYSDVFIKGELEAAFNRINPHLPHSCFEQVWVALTKPQSLDLTTNNRAFHRMLLNGFSVEYKKDDRQFHDHAFIIDFDRLDQNCFQAINQFTITGTKQPRRPDVVCFINGIPFAVLELKSPKDENVDIWDAFNQIQTYKDEIADLFISNEALVISDGYTARVGSLTANQEWFMPWRTIKNEDDRPLVEWQLETMVRGFFAPELFLDYIRFFVLFETDGDTIIKKIAGYHQFHAVREAVRATVIAAREPEDHTVVEKRATYGDEVVPGSKKAGVVWHT
ncbi:Type I restriction-modification system, restriction subunit R [Chitinispirillum alkaliphilum]|nr:Type I restriction-modification system, restriction subunit R [Chitinispirillum alkaliphilum]